VRGLMGSGGSEFEVPDLRPGPAEFKPCLRTLDSYTTDSNPIFNCLQVKREYYQNCSVLGHVTQCLQSAAHSYEQFLQVQQIGFVTLGPLRHA